MEVGFLLTDQEAGMTVVFDVAKKKTSWGGPRPGSGRKPVLTDPHRVTFDVERPDFDAVGKIAKRRGVSVAEVLRAAVRAYLGRRRD